VNSHIMFEDLPVRAFFLSDAAHAAFELTLRDCEYALLARKLDLFKAEFSSACRALDNYLCIQNAGWYQVMDSNYYNICAERKIYEAAALEYKLRNPVQTELEVRSPLAHMIAATEGKSVFEAVSKAFADWASAIRTYFETEEKLFRVFQDRLAPEIGVKVLANGGNDWEYLFRYLLVVLDNHGCMSQLVAFVLQLEKTIARCTVVEEGRLLPLVTKNVKESTLKKLRSAGFTYEDPVEQVSPETTSEGGLVRAISRNLSGKMMSEKTSGGSVNRAQESRKDSRALDKITAAMSRKNFSKNSTANSRPTSRNLSRVPSVEA